jgi:hypothetical protein
VKCSNPCEEQTGLTFYTEKCEQGKKVKSCAKPTCVVLETPNEACLAYNKNNETTHAHVPKENDNKVAKPEVKLKTNVGRIDFVTGKAWMKSDFQEQVPVSLNMKVSEDDILVTSDDGRLRIKLDNGNILNVMPNSLFKLTEVNINNKKTLIDLLKGKVRSKVETPLNGQGEYFKVRTRSAVAGVRGTDFIVSWDESDKWITKIQTLEGKVEFKSGDEKQTQTLLAGHEVSYVVPVGDSSSGVFSEEEMKLLAAKGYMTPVYRMSENEINNLNWFMKAEESQEGIREIASANKSKQNICNQPNAEFNQCMWKCENNPKGEKVCRTDLPSVNCVRRICNANGNWADEMRLPASSSEKCHPVKVQVGPCDY